MFTCKSTVKHVVFVNTVCDAHIYVHIITRHCAPPMIAFGCGHSLRCCPLSNVFEAVMCAHCHLANGKDQKEDKTDGQIAASLDAPAVGQGAHAVDCVCVCVCVEFMHGIGADRYVYFYLAVEVLYQRRLHICQHPSLSYRLFHVTTFVL